MAKYLLSTTYPMIKEPKTLLIISDHVFQSLISSVSALLFYERSKKSIPPYYDNNESKINSFKQHFVRRYKFEEYLAIMERIANFSKERKKSVMEFSRDRKYVVCGDQFSNIETVSEEDVKRYIRKAQEFVTKIDNVMASE